MILRTIWTASHRNSPTVPSYPNFCFAWSCVFSIKKSPYWFILQSAGSTSNAPTSTSSSVRGFILVSGGGTGGGGGVEGLRLISATSSLMAAHTLSTVDFLCPLSSNSFLVLP